MLGHTCCYAVSVLTALFMLVTGAIVHLIDWWDAGVRWHIFDKREDAIWLLYENERHELKFYYTRWIFIMWIITYATQLCWTLYGLELTCRKAGSAASRYHNVPVVPSVVFLLMAGAEAGVLVWLFLWTATSPSAAAYLRYSPLALLGAAVCCYAALALSASAFGRHAHVLYGIGARRYVWETRLLVDNGLGLAAAWTTIVSFYALVVALQDGGVVRPGQEGYVFLSLMAGYLLVWFAVDLSLAKRYVPHLLTPYFVFLVAEVQVLLKTELVFSYYLIYSVVLLSLTVITTIVRLSLAIGMATTRYPLS